AAEVAVVIVGPPGVIVVEPRGETGEVICYQDHWYRKTSQTRSRALYDSPSKRAQWNATRVRSDIATGGFLNTRIEGVVVFTRASRARGPCPCPCNPPVHARFASECGAVFRSAAKRSLSSGGPPASGNSRLKTSSLKSHGIRSRAPIHSR